MSAKIKERDLAILLIQSNAKGKKFTIQYRSNESGAVYQITKSAEGVDMNKYEKEVRSNFAKGGCVLLKFEINNN